MIDLITDRDRINVTRRNELAKKGYQNMTDAEKIEWLGDPFTTVGANLLPYGPAYSSAVELEYTDGAIIAKTIQPGTYLYSISMIGEAANFVGKTITLSVDSIGTIGGGSPQLALYWHDDGGFEYAGASLTEVGSVTTPLFENANNRGYLALYVYATTDVSVGVGAFTRFSGVMLEFGDSRHPYVPYSEVVVTPATKGAYNYSDLNRVERVVSEISRRCGFELTTKTNWTMWDVPTHSEMERYLGNIAFIRNSFNIEYSIPKTMNELTYVGANAIEKVLRDVLAKLHGSYRSGELYCGEV